MLWLFYLVPLRIFESMKEKISFKNDYSEGAHPRILELLAQTNLQQEPGYGYDSLSEQAKVAILRFLNNQETPVYFVAGGTQANLLVISHLLKPYESIIATESGHIHVHETGAIEATGHKINTVPHSNGKLTPDNILKVISQHTDEHMVKPAMLYISQTTELGSIYSKEELQDLSDFCKEHNLKLFIDGARMAAALSSNKHQLTLNDIAQYADVFYIGVTKNAGLLGEAIVFPNAQLAEGFSYSLKQKGALMAKGRILGAQFLALFEDDLYFELGKHANQQAMRIATALEDAGFRFALQPESNQLFPILPHQVIERLLEDFEFYVWEKLDADESIVRIVTSWATNPTDVDRFIAKINGLNR